MERYVGTDSSAIVVPIEAIRWYRFIRYSGTDSPILSTDEEFNKLESELDRLPVYGTRGHAETDQTSFGNNWLKK